MVMGDGFLSDFACMGCGECCRWEGYVRLSERELDAIAEYLDLDVSEFIERYTRITDDRRGLSLIEHPDGSCIFLSMDSGKCLINPAKPTQCRDFPLLWKFSGWDGICAWGRKKGKCVEES